MRIWLDDVRPMPDGFDLWTKTAKDCIRVLETRGISFVSFDHDLGEGKSGYDVAKVIEEMAFTKFCTRIAWEIHSANPAGRRNIELAMKSAERFWSQNEVP